MNISASDLDELLQQYTAPEAQQKQLFADLMEDDTTDQQMTADATASDPADKMNGDMSSLINSLHSFMEDVRLFSLFSLPFSLFSSPFSLLPSLFSFSVVFKESIVCRCHRMKESIQMRSNLMSNLI